MPRFTLTYFNEGKVKGLWINGPRETVPKGFWRRNTGSHSIRERQMRSRDGTVADTAVGVAHSLTRFDDVRFQAAGTTLFRSGAAISTGLDGTPLDFVVSEPRTGTDAEYLFHCGGGRLEKVEDDGTVSQWGITPPDTGNWGAAPGGNDETSSEISVIDPQERTLGDTTTISPAGTGSWFGFPAPFVSIDGVVAPSGSAICQNLVEESDDSIGAEENGLL